MKQHSKTNRGNMGVAIFAVLGVFLVLHLILPEVTLWPFLLVALVVVTMLVSHLGKSRHISQRMSQNETSGNRS